jgi:hypothetical protein
LQASTVLPTRASEVGDLEGQAREIVLVVPTPELKPEGLAAITEDLTVMCRIFDKALTSGTRSASSFAYASRADALKRLLVRQTPRTQALYLDGYGAVFFVPVDFPLVAPAPQKSQPEPQEPGDRVWSQTVNELCGQQEDAHQGGNAGPAYDAQKVESLKTTLVKALRHAANIRVRRPQDYVTLAIGAHAGGTAHEYAQLGQKLDLYARSSRLSLAGTGIQRSDSPMADPSGTLVLRVLKADVDAFAAGALTVEQLAPKVETLWSWTPRDVEKPPQPTSATPSRR